MLTTSTSHFSLREKIAVKKKRTQKAGAATRPAQNIDTCKIQSELEAGALLENLSGRKPVLVLLGPALKNPGRFPIIVDIVPPPGNLSSNSFFQLKQRLT